MPADIRDHRWSECLTCEALPVCLPWVSPPAGPVRADRFPSSILDAAGPDAAPTAPGTPPEFAHRFLRLRHWPLLAPRQAADSSACKPYQSVNESSWHLLD